MKVNKKDIDFIVKYYRMKFDDINKSRDKKLNQTKSTKEYKKVIVSTFRKQAKIINQMVKDLDKAEVEDENSTY